MTKMEWINFIGLVAVAATGAAYLGGLETRVRLLDVRDIRTSIQEAEAAALQRIEAANAAYRATHDRLDRLIGREWYNLTGVRREHQCYVNNTDFPLELVVSTTAAGRYNFCQVGVFVDEDRVVVQLDNNDSFAKNCAATVTVPPTARYHVSADGYQQGTIVSWWELRVDGPAGELQNAECAQ